MDSAPPITHAPPAVAPESSARQRRTQAQRRSEAKTKLIDSAVALIAERGLRGTSLADIGERAGFSRSIAAHHFGDKEGVLRAIAVRIRTDFHATLHHDGAVAQVGLQRILSTLETYLTNDRGRVERARAFYFMLAESMIMGGALKAEMQLFSEETLQIFETHIHQGIALGEIRPDVNPRAQAMIIVSMLRGMIGQRGYADDRLNLEEVRAQLVDNVRRMLAVG